MNEELINKLFNKEKKKVELVFENSNTILTGGLDKEDDKLNIEIYLDKDNDKEKINKLLSKKNIVNQYKYDKNGKTNIDTYNGENLLIKGNNLIVLHTLKERFTNKIDVIYIDPPYYFHKTKAKDSFAYNSNFELSSWLVFMKNRLEVAKELLTDNGVIFISTHDIGSSHLKLLCDDIFGFDNYIEQLSIENNPKGRKNSSFFSKNGEYCFVYAKNKSIINEFKEVFKKENILKDEDGNFYTNGQRILVGKSSNKNILDFKSKKNYIIYYNKKDYSIEIYFPQDHNDKKDVLNNNVVEYISKKDGFLLENTYSIDKFIDLFNKKSLIFKENTIYEKDRNIFKRAKSIIVDNNDFDLKTESATKILSNLKIDFPMSKSHKFIEMLIKMSSNSNSIILDFFAGSGTTGDAVMDLNKKDGGTRKFILVEQMDYIETISSERLKRCIQKYDYDESFIYCELEESNIKELKRKIKSVNSKEELIELIELNFKDKKDEIYSYINLIEQIAPKKVNKLYEMIRMLFLYYIPLDEDYVSFNGNNTFSNSLLTINK